MIRARSARGNAARHAQAIALHVVTSSQRGPTNPFFGDLPLQTVGPGNAGGMMMDGSAKIAQDTEERETVRLYARVMMVVLLVECECKCILRNLCLGRWLRFLLSHACR